MVYTRSGQPAQEFTVLILRDFFLVWISFLVLLFRILFAFTERLWEGVS